MYVINISNLKWLNLDLMITFYDTCKVLFYFFSLFSVYIYYSGTSYHYFFVMFCFVYDWLNSFIISIF